MTDLHLHSYFSDGKDSPEYVVQRAVNLGYKTIALTDHDGTDGLNDALAEGKRNGIKVIPGVEFSSKLQCALPGSKENMYYMHILGYGIDQNKPELAEVLEYLKSMRKERNEQVRREFCKMGIDISKEEMEAYSPSGFAGKISFANILVQRGLCGSVDEAFASHEYLKAPEIHSIKKEKLFAQDAIRLIRSAGGIAFLAHPFQLSYRNENGEKDTAGVFKDKLKLVCEELIREGMSGIECCYPTHSKEDRDFLLNIADTNGCLVSRGSDDHGAGIRGAKNMGIFEAEIDSSRLVWTEDM